MSQSAKKIASRSWLVLAAFLALGSVSNSAWAAQWTAGLTVSEAGDAGSQDLVWGVNLAATDGIDGDLGEVAQPPLPPSGNFDARLGNGALVDLRDGTELSEVKIAISFQRKAGGSITLSWDQALVAMTTTSAKILDQFGMGLVDADMRATGSVVVENPAITAVNLVFTSAAYKEPEPAASLAIAAPPNAFNGAPFTITVTGLDDAGDPGLLSETISLSLADGSGTLSGDLAVDAINGVAIFDNVSYTFDDDHDFTLSANDEDGLIPDLDRVDATVTAVTFGPPALTPLSPANDANPNQQPTFAWSDVPNAATYNLEVVDNISGDIIFSQEGIADNSLSFPGTLPDGDYSWRVASVTAALSSSSFSPDGMFTVVPLFTELGLVFLIVGMLTYAVWYIRR